MASRVKFLTFVTCGKQSGECIWVCEGTVVVGVKVLQLLAISNS